MNVIRYIFIYCLGGAIGAGLCAAWLYSCVYDAADPTWIDSFLLGLLILGPVTGTTGATAAVVCLAVVDCWYGKKVS